MNACTICLTIKSNPVLFRLAYALGGIIQDSEPESSAVLYTFIVSCSFKWVIIQCMCAYFIMFVCACPCLLFCLKYVNQNILQNNYVLFRMSCTYM